jgi:hypothetical protein
VRVILGGKPPVLDMLGRRALTAPLFAGFMWAAVAFRETLTQAQDTGASLDPLGLIFRWLALALSVRTLLLGAELMKRVHVLQTRDRYKLALCEDGLLLRTPTADYAVAKQDIIDIREHGAWGDRSGRRWAEVYLVTRPDSGRTHLALPPVFEATPGVLAEKLMRWRGVLGEKAVQHEMDTQHEMDAQHEQAAQHELDAQQTEPVERKPADLPSKLFDLAAAGESLPGSAVIRHGRAYLRRGPYATVLLGLAVLTDWMELPAAARAHAGLLAPTVCGFALIIVPSIWLLWTRMDLKPRKGIALVLTPAEMLMRTRAGVHRVLWEEIARLEITSRTAWSVLRGPHPQRALVIHRKEDSTITYDEEFLGAPAEVVSALSEGYRKGVLP